MLELRLEDNHAAVEVAAVEVRRRVRMRTRRAPATGLRHRGSIHHGKCPSGTTRCLYFDRRVCRRPGAILAALRGPPMWDAEYELRRTHLLDSRHFGE
jgi:hypothetical protein